MRIKRKLSILLCCIFTFFLTTNYEEIKAEANTESKPELVVTSMNSDNYVHLSWSSPNKDKDYSYRLFSKELSDAIFQSIPSKSTVKVLNVYPGEDSEGNPVGDNLKSWMENPNKECDKGYGKGLISVDKVNIDVFSSNAQSYLKDNLGNWKYDVLVFGFYDANGSKDISKSAIQIIEEFIEDGNGILFGHDTIIPTARPNLSSLAKYINMDGEGGEVYSKSSQVYICKKGELINYPWSIGTIGTRLTIPETHAYFQIPNGDVWMKLAGDDQFYLTSWNNAAMIQTGHSNGTATPDEQKVLANTLFYLAQVTEDTKWDDHKGQDLKAPTQPEIISVIKDSNKDIIISFNVSEDVGSSYDYYVEAKEKATGDVIKSDIKTTTVKSGLKGYSILIDENPNTIPDNIIETTSNTYEINTNIDKDMYVHVAAVDNAGNVSEVSTYKYVYPTLNVTAEDLNPENNTVKLKAEATGVQSPIKEITLPDGTIVEGSNAEYTVDVNGTYTFVAVDNEGSKISKDITVTNIPGVISLDDIKVNDDNASTTLNWNLSDKTQDYSYKVNIKNSNTEEYISVDVNDSTYVDTNAKDIAKPEKSDITSVSLDKDNGKTLITFTEAIDKGTSYDYYIDAEASTTGIKSNSEVKSATVTSGIKGYSIVVDQNEDTIPDGTITSTSTEYTFDKIYDSDFYVHVAVVDNAGNISEVSTFKYSYPVLKLTQNPTEEVKDSVTITASASCEGNNIVKIITPDGKEVLGDAAEYTVDVNGVYTFTAIDDKGDEVSESINITNIKPDIIINVEPNMNKVHLEEHFTVDITADHIKDIGGFDLILKYDSDKLKLTGYGQVSGVDYFVKRLGPGEIRLNLVAMTVDNFLYSKKTLITLGFDPIADGDALIDITKAKMSDGLFLEKKLRDAECGETTINIVDRKLTSVNSGDNEFTLLDEIIVSRHMGEDPAALLLAGIDADLNLDGKIDEADVKKAHDLMMKNPNYEI